MEGLNKLHGRDKQIKHWKHQDFLASPANGTYTLSFNATNMSSLNLGTKTYQPSITIYWDDEF